MALRAPRHEQPAGNAAPEWLTLAAARDLLGAASEDVLRYWVRLRLLRSCALPDGELRVSREDVLYQKGWQDINAAFPGEEMTEEELAARHQAGQELLPWRQTPETPAA